jgi:hypothetical protein
VTHGLRSVPADLVHGAHVECGRSRQDRGAWCRRGGIQAVRAARAHSSRRGIVSSTICPWRCLPARTALTMGNSGRTLGAVPAAARVSLLSRMPPGTGRLTGQRPKCHEGTLAHRPPSMERRGQPRARVPAPQTETVLYGLVRQQMESLPRPHPRALRVGRGPRYVEEELRGYLRCGVFSEVLLGRDAMPVVTISSSPSRASRAPYARAAPDDAWPILRSDRGSSVARRSRAPVRPDLALRAAQAGRLQGGRAHRDRAHRRRGDLREPPLTRQARRDREWPGRPSISCRDLAT